MSGKPVEVTDTPVVHEAFQWDGTLEDAKELYKWMIEKDELRAFSYKFVAYPCLESREPNLVFDNDRFKDQVYNNELWPMMWIVFNTRTHAFSLHSDRVFRELYEEKV